MGRTSNVHLVQVDETSPFIRVGTIKYRPPSVLEGLKRGQTIRAWPWSGGMKVEHEGAQTVWPRA